MGSAEAIRPESVVTGTIPEPTIASLRAMVDKGDFHTALQSPTATDPRLVWISHHCRSVPPPAAANGAPVVGQVSIYFCIGGG
jgi:hypothetical protein